MKQILEKLGNIEQRIANIEAGVVCKNCNSKQVKEVKKVKDWVLECSDLLINFFKEKGVEYDEDQDVDYNMTNLCNELDTNIKITTCGKVIYQNKDVHKFVENYTLTNKEGIKLARNKIVCNNPKPCNFFDENNKANASKKEFDKCFTILGIDKTYNLFDIRTKVLQKMVSGYGLEKLTDEERYLCDRDNIRGDVKYLIEKNFTLPNNCYSYDINSFHGAVIREDYKFPIRAGTRKYLETIDPNVFGIYAIKTDDIEYFKPKNSSKIWYTSEYIKLLDSEGIGYELIKDYDYNAVVYNDYDLMSGSTLFKECIDLLYSEKKNKLCKNILSSIVGHINGGKKSQEKTKLMEDLTVDDLMSFKKCKNVAFNEQSTTFEDKDENKYNYVFDTARFKPFVYDYFKIYNWNKYIKKHDGHIIRLCTDSFLINKKLRDCPDIGDGIGMIKPELFLKKGLVYPKANHSFKTNGVIGMTYIWDKDSDGKDGTKGCYIQTPEKDVDGDDEDDSEYSDEDDSEYSDEDEDEEDEQ